MTSWSLRKPLAAALLCAGLVGCGGDKSRPDASTNAEPAAESAAAQEGGTQATAQAKADAPPTRDKLHVAFADAVRGADDPPPADAARPPDETVSKKPVHRLLDGVKAQWDAIRFTSPAGKPLDFTATVETTAGNI